MQFQLFQMLIVQTDLVPEIHSLRPLGQIRKALILSIVKYSRQLNTFNRIWIIWLSPSSYIVSYLDYIAENTDDSDHDNNSVYWELTEGIDIRGIHMGRDLQ